MAELIKPYRDVHIVYRVFTDPNGVEHEVNEQLYEDTPDGRAAAQGHVEAHRADPGHKVFLKTIRQGF
jgi:hypothetical protein